MNQKSQRALFNYLQKNNIKKFVGVPDSTMKYFIDEGLKKNDILVATREEEAIGISAGFSLSGINSLVFMQNAGFANSISTITSLVQLYKIPMILLIGWRGFLKNDAPEHKKIGKIQQKLIKILGLQIKILDDETWEESCNWAISELKNGKLVGLIIKREFLD